MLLETATCWIDEKLVKLGCRIGRSGDAELLLNFLRQIHHENRPAMAVGNGGMDYGDFYWGLCRDYYRDPFPHSLLSTRESLGIHLEGASHLLVKQGGLRKSEGCRLSGFNHGFRV